MSVKNDEESIVYKYIRYISILVWTLVRKVVGLVWYFVAVPFRKYARSTVYNYVLQNGIYLKRLGERPIVDTAYGWEIKPYHGTTGGYIDFKKVYWIEYILVYWLIWGWLDDDSYCDTTSEVFLEEHIGDIRNPQGVSDDKALECLKKCNGNSFDKGDALEENWCAWLSVAWNIRNTAYNFKYMQWEENRPEMLFYHTKFGWEFGYIPKGQYNEGRLVFGRVK